MFKGLPALSDLGGRPFCVFLKDNPDGVHRDLEASRFGLR